ncbi:glycosyltransferase family 4 protein [Methanoculleus oceani]|uniref:Glycosyltransferase n=1 Tax=Methanoculleus oceani TaxID=2184756 RepID=A0ABD4TEI2_9EURY|nr:glycosyltransferase family 4 protein [Methanoculleus sp. CWC-02]MCM2465812.1 glycosyltransferase [Methanoculleus sp. CWC-02]
MKVLLMQLNGKGGTQLYLSQLAAALSETDNEVVVLTSRYLYEEAHYPDNNVKLILFDFHPTYGRALLSTINPLTYFRLLRVIGSEKPDVIHLLFEDALAAITLYLIRRRFAIILTEHDPAPHAGEHILVKLNWSFARSLLEPISSRIIVHGKNLKDVLLSRGIPEAKIAVIPHGDYSYYTKWRDESIESNGETILFFGSIKEYKGLRYLIKAVPAVCSHHPKANVIIAGGGDFSKYETMEEYRKYKSVFEVHNDYIPDEDIAPLFQRATVVVLPYIDASQSGIIPIAYAFRKPVIVTDVGSIAEVVEQGKTGIIIPPKDEKALADAIIAVLNDKQACDEMAQNAYAFMKENLSWATIAKRMHAVYHEVASRERKPSGVQFQTSSGSKSE